MSVYGRMVRDEMYGVSPYNNGTSASNENGNESEKLEELSNNVESLSNDVESLSTNVESLSTNVESLSTNVESLSTNVESLSTNVESLGDNVDSLSEVVVNIKSFGVKGDNTTDDTVNIQTALNSGKTLRVPKGIYKITSPINVPPHTELIFEEGAVFDMTAINTGVGFTTRVGSVFRNIKLRYSSKFDGVGWYFTTVDNDSSTSNLNTDTNRYVIENITIEKVYPTTGTIYDWNANAVGLAFKMEGIARQNPLVISGFWGANIDGIVIKGAWLQSGLITDDGTGWITSSAISHVVIDGARRGIQIDSTKSGNLNISDVHMQGARFTKSGSPDVITEWMLKVDKASYCHFSDFQPQDFSGGFSIQNFIQFNSGANKCSFESMYIVSDNDILDTGANTRIVTPLGIKFPNLAVSSNNKVLDWYEEGTFTVNVIGSTANGTCTYTTRGGSFTRIGKVVNFSLEVGWTGHTGTGNLRIGSLPYTSNTTDASSVLNISVSSLAFGTGQLKAIVGKGAIIIDLYSVTDNAAITSVPISSSAGVVRITGAYTV